MLAEGEFVGRGVADEDGEGEGVVAGALAEKYHTPDTRAAMATTIIRYLDHTGNLELITATSIIFG